MFRWQIDWISYMTRLIRTLTRTDRFQSQGTGRHFIIIVRIPIIFSINSLSWSESLKVHQFDDEAWRLTPAECLLSPRLSSVTGDEETPAHAQLLGPDSGLITDTGWLTTLQSLLSVSSSVTGRSTSVPSRSSTCQHVLINSRENKSVVKLIKDKMFL